MRSRVVKGILAGALLVFSSGGLVWGATVRYDVVMSLDDPQASVTVTPGARVAYVITCMVTPGDPADTTSFGGGYVTLNTDLGVAQEEVDDFKTLDVIKARPGMGLPVVPWRGTASGDDLLGVGWSNNIFSEAADNLFLNEAAVFARGSLTIPSVEGTYHIQVSADTANVMTLDLTRSQPADEVVLGAGFTIVVSSGVVWYRDADGDGYGDPDDSTTSATQPAGYVSDNTDCDDALAGVHPGGEEVADGQDNDCNGTADDLPDDGEGGDSGQDDGGTDDGNTDGGGTDGSGTDGGSTDDGGTDGGSADDGGMNDGGTDDGTTDDGGAGDGGTDDGSSGGTNDTDDGNGGSDTGGTDTDDGGTTADDSGGDTSTDDGGTNGTDYPYHDAPVRVDSTTDEETTEDADENNSGSWCGAGLPGFLGMSLVGVALMHSSKRRRW